LLHIFDHCFQYGDSAAQTTLSVAELAIVKNGAFPESIFGNPKKKALDRTRGFELNLNAKL
jgi:hypothetical protein